jgi:hypothetical protein
MMVRGHIFNDLLCPVDENKEKLLTRVVFCNLVIVTSLSIFLV